LETHFMVSSAYTNPPSLSTTLPVTVPCCDP
jgi:hypothetical protein